VSLLLSPASSPCALHPPGPLIGHWEHPIKSQVLCSLNPNYTPGTLTQSVFPIDLKIKTQWYNVIHYYIIKVLLWIAIFQWLT
jgi:hypothetical protein